jgi:hypothetical protein
MHRQRNVAIAVSLTAMVFAVLHTVYPHLGIDWVTLSFVGMAVLPWAVSLFRSLEIAGVIKMEMAVREVVERAVETGLLASPAVVVDAPETKALPEPPPAPPLQALLALRHEIRRLLAELAEAGPRSQPISNLTTLQHSNLVTREEWGTISALIRVLNRVAHNDEDLTPEGAAEILDVGQKIVRTLSDRLVEHVSLTALAEQLQMTPSEALDYIVKDENVTGLSYHITVPRSALKRVPRVIAQRLVEQRRKELGKTE